MINSRLQKGEAVLVLEPLYYWSIGRGVAKCVPQTDLSYNNSAGLWNRFSLMSLIITPTTHPQPDWQRSCVNFHNYNCSTSTPKLARLEPSRPFVHCTNMDLLKQRTASRQPEWEVRLKCLNHLVWWITTYYLPWIPIHHFTKILTVWMVRIPIFDNNFNK